MKKKDFTKEELEFLSNKIERGAFLTEEKRISLEDIYDEYRIVNGVNYHFTFNSKERIAQKAEIIKAINEAGDFRFEFYDDDGNATLITYNSIPEPDEVYLERLRIEGRKLITLEKSRLARISKQETRKVLFEKTKKKKAGRPKEYPLPDFRPAQPEHRHYDIDMLLDYDFFHRGA